MLIRTNFGSKPEEAFKKLKGYEDGPMVCMEFWNGWFDHWGESHIHHTRDAKDMGKVFVEMLKLGASVNFYMFHGVQTSASIMVPTIVINMSQL